MLYNRYMSEAAPRRASGHETTQEIRLNADGLPEHPVTIDSTENYRPLEEYDDGFHDDPNASLIDNLSAREAVHFHKVRVEKNTTAENSVEHATETGVILYVAEGSLICVVRNIAYQLHAGDQLVIPPKATYKTYTGVGSAARTLLSTVDASERESLENSEPIVVLGSDKVPMSEEEILQSDIPDGDSRGGNQETIKDYENRVQLNKIKYNKNYKHPEDETEGGEVTKVELHLWRGEIWTCLSGEMVVETDGVMVNPKVKEDGREIRAESLIGSRRVVLRPGMQIYVPPGIAHMHYTGAGRAAQVLFQRCPAPRTLSPDEVAGM